MCVCIVVVFGDGAGGGGVIPGLLGPWSMQDPVGWSDDVTLDYNAGE